MSSQRPTAISLFSGAGGLCLGFEQAGFDVPLAVEIDPIHAATHQRNFPLWKTLNDPVETVIAKDVYAVVGDRPIDVLFGGSPCQSFSLQGKRDSGDQRSSLIREFIRLVAELQPKYFVFENVKGLTLTSCLPVLESAIAQLQALGYRVPPWRILNAKDYGVPQHRERLFLLGSRQGLPVATYPEPTGTVSVIDALVDIPNASDDYWYLGDGIVKNFDMEMPRTTYAKQMRVWQRHNSNYRLFNESILHNSHPTKHSAEVIARFAATPPGKREPISRFHRLDPNGIAPTLRAGTDSQRGSHTAPRPIHYEHPRCITVREMARLSGFPDWFRFDDRTWHGARQIGNAVPPPLAHAIARQIAHLLIT